MEKCLEKVNKKFTGILPYQKPVLPNRQVKEKLKNPCWTINPSGVSFYELSRAHTVSKITLNAYRYPACDRQWDRQYGKTICGQDFRVLSVTNTDKPNKDRQTTEISFKPPVQTGSLTTGCIKNNAFCSLESKNTDNSFFFGSLPLVQGVLCWFA